jgi:hypothetical protein
MKVLIAAKPIIWYYVFKNGSFAPIFKLE